MKYSGSSTLLRVSCAISVLAVVTSLSSDAGASDPARVAHPVTAPGGMRVVDAAPGELPSAAHPEGTVYARVATALPSAPNVVELDVATGAELHRGARECRLIRRAGDSLFAICGGDFVEMDRTLAEIWHLPAPQCGPSAERRDLTLAAASGGRAISVFTCNGAISVAVVSTAARRIDSVARTNIPSIPAPQGDVALFVHGEAIGALVRGSIVLPSTLFVLTPDNRHVLRALTLGDGETFRDDGTHVHLSLTQAALDGARIMSAPPAGEGKAPRPTQRRGLPWLTVDRDFTLTDALTPLSSAALSVAPSQGTAHDQPAPAPQGLGGEGVQSTFTLGAVSLYLTYACCGGARGAGLYALPPAKNR